jgi:Domain of unknown function (DUF4190)
MAIVALVAAVASWIGFPLIAAVVAIFCGHKARSEIRAGGGAEEGDPLAVGALVLAYANIVISCVAGAIALAIFGGIFATALAALGYHDYQLPR